MLPQSILSLQPIETVSHVHVFWDFDSMEIPVDLDPSRLCDTVWKTVEGNLSA